MSVNDQILAILRDKLDPSTLGIIEAAIKDSDRLAVIRDAFLDGDDVRAVQMIRDLDPMGNRKVLGATSDILVEKNQTVQITTRPQIHFTPDHFAMSPSVAPYFMIDDIRVATRSQWIQAGRIAGDLFATDVDEILSGEVDAEGFYNIKIGKKAEARWGLRINMPTAMVGMDLIVIATCIDGGASGLGYPFRGAFLGRTESL